MAIGFHQLTSEIAENLLYRKTPNPSLHPTAYSGLRPLPSAGELKLPSYPDWASQTTVALDSPELRRPL